MGANATTNPDDDAGDERSGDDVPTTCDHCNEAFPEGDRLRVIGAAEVVRDDAGDLTLDVDVRQFFHIDCYLERFGGGGSA